MLKYIFLQHAGRTIPGTSAPATNSPTAGIIILALLAAGSFGLWFYFTRKKKY